MNIKLILINPDIELYPEGIVEAIEVDMVDHGLQEVPKQKQDLTKYERKLLDKDDEEYLEEIEEKAPVEIVQATSTFFLIASEVTGKFEWISEDEVLLLESNAGKKLLRSKKWKKKLHKKKSK